MLDDEIGTTLAGDRPPEGSFYLLGDILLIEDGNISCIETDYILSAGSDLLDILAYLLVVSLVIDIDTLEGGIECVSEYPEGTTRFFVYDLRSLGYLGEIRCAVFPATK